MFKVLATNEFWAPSFTSRVTGIIIGICDYGGVPENELPV